MRKIRYRKHVFDKLKNLEAIAERGQQDMEELELHHQNFLVKFQQKGLPGQ